MATINHPGVVNVYDYGSDQGVTYLIMEYIEGDALSKTLSRVGRLTPGRTMSLIAQAADALQAAHDKGIVHRDVKPANLMVRPNGTLVLTDFGIARSAQASQLTAVGSVLGTASYISPEQASGQLATAASDVYALGVVAYQCLSGRRPFEGGSPIEIALQHVDARPAAAAAGHSRPGTGAGRPLSGEVADRPVAQRGCARRRGTSRRERVRPCRPRRPTRPISGAPASPGPVGPDVRSRPAGSGRHAGAAAAAAAAATRLPAAGVPAAGAAARPVRVPAPSPEPQRGRAGVVILGIVLAILVVCSGRADRVRREAPQPPAVCAAAHADRRRMPTVVDRRA